MDVGSYGALGKSQFRGNHGRTVSLQPHIVNGVFVLQFHSDIPFVITADKKGG